MTMTGLCSPVQPDAERSPPTIFADEVGDEDEGELIPGEIQFSGSEIWTLSTDLSFPRHREKSDLGDTPSSQLPWVTDLDGLPIKMSSPSGCVSFYRDLLPRYRGTSLIGVHLHLGPYRRPMPRVLGVS